MEASVPVFGNCCLDLPADSDGVSEDNVSAEADTLAEVDALVDADSDALVLADADALVDADSETDVLTEVDALVDADSEADVLADADVDTEALIESEVTTLSISRVALEWISGNPLLVTTDALVLAD